MSANSKPLTLGIERSPRAAVVRLGGSVTLMEADRLRQDLECLAGERIPLVILDLTALDFICSMGLGAIVALHLKSRHHSGKVRLVNPCPSIRNLLETTRLTHVFPIFPDVPSAEKG